MADESKLLSGQNLYTSLALIKAKRQETPKITTPPTICFVTQDIAGELYEPLNLYLYQLYPEYPRKRLYPMSYCNYSPTVDNQNCAEYALYVDGTAWLVDESHIQGYSGLLALRYATMHPRIGLQENSPLYQTTGGWMDNWEKAGASRKSGGLYYKCNPLGQSIPGIGSPHIPVAATCTTIDDLHWTIIEHIDAIKQPVGWPIPNWWNNDYFTCFLDRLNPMVITIYWRQIENLNLPPPHLEWKVHYQRYDYHM